MKSIPVVLTFLALIAVVFSGCIGGDDVAPEDDGLKDNADEAVVTTSTGSIRGTVASDLFEPLGGAQVALVEVERQTKVARNGEFTMNEVDPGTYTLHIVALGYASTQRSVSVQAGEISEVSVQMIPAAGTSPYFEQRHVVETIGSSVIWQVEVPGQGCVVEETPARDVKSCSGLGGNVLPYNVTPEVQTILVEMVWNPAGPLGEYLQLDLICESAPRGAGGSILDTEHPCYYAAPGRTSPLIIRADQTDTEGVEDYKWQGDWDIRVFGSYGIGGTYDATGADVGVAYEQKYEYFVTTFYHAPAPDGYSGLPDQ